MIQRELGGSCKQCIHYQRREGWWCALVSVAELQAKGYDIKDEKLPRPEEFVCDDAFEPP